MTMPVERSSVTPTPPWLTGVEPTERVTWSLVVTALCGALGAVAPALGELSLYALCALVALCIVDVMLCASPRRIKVERVLPGPVTAGMPAALVWTLESPRATRVQLSDSLPPSTSEGDAAAVLEAELRLGGRECVGLQREVTFARMGHYLFGRIALRTVGPLGLVRLRARIRIFTEVKVLPDLVHLTRRAERVLKGRDSVGRRRAPVPRDGGELDSLREYQRGDDVRLVEWKASARARQLVVKRMVPETRREVMLLLDTGRQLTGARREGVHVVPRLEEAAAVALTVAAAALQRGDRVGLIAFAAEVRAYLPPSAGHAQLRRLAESITALDVVPEESDFAGALRFLCARQQRRARVFIVSDLIDDVSARALSGAIPLLRGRHSALMLALGDPVLVQSSRNAPGDAHNEIPWRGLAASRLVEQRRRGLAAVGAAGCKVVDVLAGDASAPALRACLLAEFR